MISNRSSSPTSANRRSICTGPRTITRRRRLRRARASVSTSSRRPVQSQKVSSLRSITINSAHDSAACTACSNCGALARSSSPRGEIQAAARSPYRTSTAKCSAAGRGRGGDLSGGPTSGKAASRDQKRYLGSQSGLADHSHGRPHRLPSARERSSATTAEPIFLPSARVASACPARRSPNGVVSRPTASRIAQTRGRAQGRTARSRCRGRRDGWR